MLLNLYNVTNNRGWVGKSASAHKNCYVIMTFSILSMKLMLRTKNMPPAILLKILLIEDNADHADLIKRCIKKALPTAKLKHCTTLKDGVLSLKDSKYNIILLDLRLPDSNIEFTLHRVVENFPNIPIVVLSSLKDDEIASKSLLIGAQDYLCKEDISAESIARIVRHSLERKQLEYKLKQYAEELEKRNFDLEKVIDERTKDLSNSERQYRSLVHLAPLGIIRLDKRGTITFSNPEFSRIFGYQRDETDHKLSFSDLIHSDDLKQALNYLQLKMKSPITHRETLRLVKKSREICWCKIIISPIGDGERFFDHFVCIIDDITKQKEQEKLAQEKRIAEEASRAKTDFLTNISHEIRTPLAAVTGFIDLALECENEEQRCSYLRIAKRNSKHLYALVNDLLDLSKIEAGQMDAKKSYFSLTEEVSNVIAVVRAGAIAKGLQLNVKYHEPLPELVYSDPNKFRQILINLVNNSIKYTDIGKITVTIEIHQENLDSDATLIVSVIDTGQGINSNFINQLFQPFARDGKDKVFKKEGLGVGLALSRNLARMLDGDIYLEKTSSQGSVFKLSLNVGKPRSIAYVDDERSVINQPTKKDVLTATIGSLAGFRILVAEDAQDLQILVRYYLEKNGAQVDLCEDGISAMEHALQNDYDCVLMDIQMPKMNGDLATIKLRELGYKGKIIALTAHAFQQERTHCLASGFDEFLTKPVVEKEMVSMIKTFDRYHEKGKFNLPESRIK